MGDDVAHDARRRRWSAAASALPAAPAGASRGRWKRDGTGDACRSGGAARAWVRDKDTPHAVNVTRPRARGLLRQRFARRRAGTERPRTGSALASVVVSTMPFEGGVVLDEGGRVAAGVRQAQLVAQHHGVGRGFPLEVVVRVEVHLLHEHLDRLRDLDERVELLAPSRGSRSDRPTSRGSTTPWRCGRAGAGSRSPRRWAGSSARSTGGTSARRSGPRRRATRSAPAASS